MSVGLTSQQAKERLATDGYNELEEKKPGIKQKLIKNLRSPITVMLLLASALSFGINKTFDGYFILVLLFLNVSITIWQENKADTAIAKLNEHLSQILPVLRDGKWQKIPTRELVVGDVVKLSAGDVVPADGIVTAGDHLVMNESALTGESLPKEKKAGEQVFSGTYLVSGIAEINVTATGARTSFGKTLFTIESSRKKSVLEKDIINISKILTWMSLFAVMLLTAAFWLQNADAGELLTLDLGLVIAGVPVSLPTVMTLIIEIGVLTLAKREVVVRRLSALEDLANVTFLLTDKTGTLTLNKIAVGDIYAYGEFTHDQVIGWAGINAGMDPENPLSAAIIKKCETMKVAVKSFTKNDFVPGDPDRKRSTAIIDTTEGETTVTVGAPQVVENHCRMDRMTREKYEREVESLAKGGYRTLAVAKAAGGKEQEMQMIGLLALSDDLRPEAPGIAKFLEDNGIGVAMVTGDNRSIAAQIAKKLFGRDKKIVTREELEKTGWDKVNKEMFVSTAAFAEMLPTDKLSLVQKAKKIFMVAANGDGVNDLPAIKAANVGIAVKNAVSVLKGSADIVLLSDGIGVVRDAIIESRKIFQRVYTYSLYRMSESFRLIVTIVILGIWYHAYPVTALQIIILALLNDIPIITLAFDRVKIAHRPSKINVRERTLLSGLFGMVGVVNSILLFVLVFNIWKLPWETVQTMYFLKLTVSGHMLIYVAHTKEKWYKFLPSREVIWATSLTQLAATGLAATGWLMPTRLEVWQIALVWGWAFLWMLVSEEMKTIKEKLVK